MADGRRRTWIAADVNYYGGDLGREIRYRFGAAGLVVFDAFLRACKRNAIEGEVAYFAEADFLAQMGLSGMPLVDNVGEEWPLDALWSLLADHKQIRRRQRGGLVHVASSRWDEWQKRATRPGEGQKNRRSEAINTDEMPDGNGADVNHYRDRDQLQGQDLTTSFASPQADDAPAGETSTAPNGKKRGTRLPEPFEVSDRMRSWAAEKCPTVNVDDETEQFCDFHAGKGSVQADWTATWRTWMRNAVKFANARGGVRPAGGVPAGTAWERVHSALQRGQRPKFDDRTEEVIAALGGWQALRTSTNQVADRAHFIRFYEGR